MNPTSQDPELQESIEELQRYFSDQVAPLLVADSLEMILTQPPEVAAHGIASWVSGQYQVAGMSVAELYFHALKKLKHLGELGLLDSETLASKLPAVTGLVVAHCPPEERTSLETMLPHLEGSTATTTPAVGVLQRPGGPAGQAPVAGAVPHAAAPAAPAAGAAPPPPPPLPAAAALAGGTTTAPLADPDITRRLVDGLERFSMLLQQNQRVQSPEATGAVGATQVTSQLIGAAVEQARSQEEMQVYLAQLRQKGFEGAGEKELLRTLSESIPDWAVVSKEGAPDPGSGALQTIRRLVSLSESPSEGKEKLEQLVALGVEQFNAGNLARAVKLFHLAQEMVENSQVDRTSIDLLLGKAHEALDPEQLRDLPKVPENHPLLSRALAFFPAYKCEALLVSLDGEPDRSRRYLYLSLLVVHGNESRQLALDRLREILEEGADDESWKFLRNLIYLLRHIPAPRGGAGDDELRMASGMASLDEAMPLIRETVGYLGVVDHKQADKVLITRLREVEETLLGTTPSIHSPEDRDRLAGAIVKALIQAGSPRALRAVVDHGLKQNAALGDTRERLAELGSVDLVAAPDLSDKLLAALKKELPTRVLGLLVKKVSQRGLDLVKALSGTTTEAVRKALEEIANGYSGEPIAEAAREALERRRRRLEPEPDTPARAATSADEDGGEPGVSSAPSGPEVQATAKPSFSGDLAVFGVPNLLQNLAQSELTGRLTVTDREDQPRAVLEFHSGDLGASQMGALSGDLAFYQLLEEPFPGYFEFMEGPEAVQETAETSSVVGLLMEGMRRYDELQRLKTRAPDETRLQPTGVRPKAAPEEKDGEFLRQVWTAVKGGATPRECEAKIPMDSYRIRFILAYWIEMGALAPSA